MGSIDISFDTYLDHDSELTHQSTFCNVYRAVLTIPFHNDASQGHSYDAIVYISRAKQRFPANAAVRITGTVATITSDSAPPTFEVQAIWVDWIRGAEHDPTFTITTTIPPRAVVWGVADIVPEANANPKEDRWFRLVADVNVDGKACLASMTCCYPGAVERWTKPRTPWKGSTIFMRGELRANPQDSSSFCVTPAHVAFPRSGSGSSSSTTSIGAPPNMSAPPAPSASSAPVTPVKHKASTSSIVTPTKRHKATPATPTAAVPAYPAPSAPAPAPPPAASPAAPVATASAFPQAFASAAPLHASNMSSFFTDAQGSPMPASLNIGAIRFPPHMFQTSPHGPVLAPGVSPEAAAAFFASLAQSSPSPSVPRPSTQPPAPPTPSPAHLGPRPLPPPSYGPATPGAVLPRRRAPAPANPVRPPPAPHALDDANSVPSPSYSISSP